jgi:hypothetical protein
MNEALKNTNVHKNYLGTKGLNHYKEKIQTDALFPTKVNRLEINKD